MRRSKKGRAGLKLKWWPAIGQDGGALLTPYCLLRDKRNWRWWFWTNHCFTI